MKSLNDAINHAAQIGGESDDERGREHRQLSLWLQELRQLRKVEADKNFDLFTGRLLQRGWRLSPDGKPQIIKGGHNPVSIEVLRIIAADFLTYSVHQLEQLAKVADGTKASPIPAETSESSPQSNDSSDDRSEPPTSVQPDAPDVQDASAE